MTTNLAYASVPSAAAPRTAARVAVARPLRAPAPVVPVAACDPHVDEARVIRALLRLRPGDRTDPASFGVSSTRVDDALFGLATLVLMVAVASPLPAALSLIS